MFDDIIMHVRSIVLYIKISTKRYDNLESAPGSETLFSSLFAAVHPLPPHQQTFGGSAEESNVCCQLALYSTSQYHIYYFILTTY